MAAEEVGPVGTGLALEGIRKSYGPVPVLHGLGVEVRPGELLTLLGPSGSGKTTLLKVIAGFEQLDGGSIRLGGRQITRVPAAKREIGMVFQNYALFPHMTVRANIAFPLEMRRLARADIARRTEAALAMVNLEGFGDRLPKQLSGGQQQRVALARAVVFEPQLLLLDEPFGALDRKLRESMQLEVRALQRRLAITTIFITHDQDEALVMSDRIAVMNAGRIEQLGTPLEVYERPATVFVAGFLGESNYYPGVVRKGEVRLENGAVLPSATLIPEGTRVGAVIRPERLVRADGDDGWRGVVADAVYLGIGWKYRVRLREGMEMLVRAPATEAPLQVGECLGIRLTPADVHLIRLE